MYTFLISAGLNGIVRVLGLSEKNIINFKKIKSFDIKDVSDKKQSLYKILKIKIILFYVIIFSLLGFFWYYVTSFCGIYRNTQLHLIKDSLCSFATSLLTPFPIFLLPGFLRILALKKKSKFFMDYPKFYKMFKFI